MMRDMEIGPRLNELEAIQFAEALHQYDGATDLVIDFAQTQHFEPFGMLLLGSAIRRATERAAMRGGSVLLPCDGINGEGIAAHMGFWRSIGMPLGREVNAPSAKNSYVSVSRLDVGQVMREAGNCLPLAIASIEKEANRLAAVLVSPARRGMYDAIRYSLREVIRNGVEHAQTPVVWYAGMAWPQRGFVQIAILDEGRGVRASLNSNSHYRFETDAQAIDAAILPGVSRNMGRRLSQRELEQWSEAQLEMPPEHYQNSGYGLYVVSEIAKAAGQFILCSGSHAKQMAPSHSMNHKTQHVGTALRVVLYPERIEQVMDEVFERLRGTTSGPTTKRPLITASMMRRLKLADDPEPSCDSGS